MAESLVAMRANTSEFEANQALRKMPRW
jgi:hypothetical protein